MFEISKATTISEEISKTQKIQMSLLSALDQARSESKLRHHIIAITKLSTLEIGVKLKEKTPQGLECTPFTTTRSPTCSSRRRALPRIQKIDSNMKELDSRWMTTRMALKFTCRAHTMMPAQFPPIDKMKKKQSQGSLSQDRQYSHYLYDGFTKGKQWNFTKAKR